MFIGQIQAQALTGNSGIPALRSNVLSASKQTMLPQYDQVEIGTRSQTNSYTGLYKPNGDQMKMIEAPSYTRVSPDSRLQNELLPPSEQPSYTEEDALLNQYMKQSRIDGYFDGDTFVCTSSGPVRLILKDAVTKEELEPFQTKLAEQGLGDEIDWQGVKGDFIQIGVGFDNIERFEQKADYLASRYAVLKDRIQSQYTGEEQETELQKLEQIYTKAKEEMADSYAGSIGSFFEDLGQSGAAEDMRNSVLALVDQKADAYTDFLAKTDIYAGITDPGKQWLKQDDGYMAAQLRESASASQSEQKTQSDEAPYDGKDLSYAGVYAKMLYQQLQNPSWDVKESDTALGKRLASQYSELKNSVARAGISEKMAKMLTSSFTPFMGRLMGTLDEQIDRNRGWVAESPWLSGSIRTAHIDRASVYASFQNAVSKS